MTALCTRSPSSSSPASPTRADLVTVRRSCPSMVTSVVRARAATGTSKSTIRRKACGKQEFIPAALPTETRGAKPVGNLDGKVAFITGAGRGQGRAHAVRLAADGADTIALDTCRNIAPTAYPNASPEDLDETAKLVEKEGGRIVARQADVRDADAVEQVVADGLAEFGRLDIVIANAGVIRLGPGGNRRQTFRDIIDVNLIGMWNPAEATQRALIDGGRGGSIVLTSSSAGLKGTGTDRAGGQAYTAAKRGLVGLMQVWANEFAQYSIRVNTIHPTGVATGMVMNETMGKLLEANDTAVAAMQNALPIQILMPEDIANAVACLVSEEAKFITGTAWPLDAGFAVRCYSPRLAPHFVS